LEKEEEARKLKDSTHHFFVSFFEKETS